jgi:hypothetical protein
MPTPGDFVDWNGDGSPDELDSWIEIRHGGESTLNLGGWSLATNAAGENAYYFPANTKIKGEHYLLLYRAQTGLDLSQASSLHLFDDKGRVVDSVVLGNLPVDASYSLDEEGRWHDDWLPTPGLANQPLGARLFKGISE